MMGKMNLKILILLAASAIAASAANYERERYDVIVERSPFGEVLSAGNPSETPDLIRTGKQIEELKKKIRLCFLLQSESGEVRAGFQNVKAQKGDPKSVMLLIGETFEGMQLQSINMEHSNATLSINGMPVTFELEKAAAVAKKVPAKKPTVPANRFKGGLRRKST